jgi:hypothetical protein
MGWWQKILGRREVLEPWQEAARRAHDLMGDIPKDYRPTEEERELITALFVRVGWILRRWRG